jgi:hypothetical protein
MGLGDGHALVSPILAATVLVVAALLSARQWAERRARASGLDAADRRHFARQDIRRFTGVSVMALVGLGIAWGSRIDPKGDGRSKRLFLAVWLVVILLVFFLVVLAFFDLLSTQLFARRRRRALAAESRRALRAESKPRRASLWDGLDGANGEAHARGSPPG